jgi:hypothetical protein
VLAPGATVAFDDYANPDYPGVREAIAELGLTGGSRGSLFVHAVPERDDGPNACPAARR